MEILEGMLPPPIVLVTKTHVCYPAGSALHNGMQEQIQTFPKSGEGGTMLLDEKTNGVWAPN